MKANIRRVPTGSTKTFMKLLLKPAYGAKVCVASDISEKHRRTGAWAKLWEDDSIEGIVQVAVCILPGESGFNLLCIDANGNVLFDSAHESIEEACAYAEMEYEGLANTWQTVQ